MRGAKVEGFIMGLGNELNKEGLAAKCFATDSAGYI